jgi:hypothetical protein
MPIYFSWFITALLSVSGDFQRSQLTVKWAPFILRVLPFGLKKSPCAARIRQGVQVEILVFPAVKCDPRRFCHSFAERISLLLSGCVESEGEKSSYFMPSTT